MGREGVRVAYLLLHQRLTTVWEAMLPGFDGMFGGDVPPENLGHFGTSWDIGWVTRQGDEVLDSDFGELSRVEARTRRETWGQGDLAQRDESNDQWPARAGGGVSSLRLIVK
jgi:hypothetical protein